jgi:hypothetical protein
VPGNVNSLSVKRSICGVAAIQFLVDWLFEVSIVINTFLQGLKSCAALIVKLSGAANAGLL